MKVRVGFAMCGSFCTLDRVIEELRLLVEDEYDVIPIMSEMTYTTDTRFGKSEDFIREIEDVCGRPILHTIPQVEPIGPKGLLDILVIAPCTGNTLGKLACGIFDTSVTMAAKAHLRNHRPVLIAVSTNDGLSTSAKNIGKLLAQKNIYFVPMSQDDPQRKPDSLVANYSKLISTLQAALEGKQLEPIYFGNL